MKKGLWIMVVMLTATGWAYAKHGKRHTGADIEYVSLDHGACYGRCPVYTVDIYSDGIARYTGKRFVQDSGVYEKMVGVANVKPLMEKIRIFQVDTCRDSYEYIPDVPSTTLTIKYYSGKTKKIENASHGPDFLGEIASDMNALAHVAPNWIKRQ